MLKLDNITVLFPSKPIFNDACFEAYPKEITVLIGESGTGKTTLFETILLHIDAKETYIFNNEKIHEFNKKEKEEYLLNHVSYASQKPTFIADLTMLDQIELLKKIYHSEKEVKDLITLFELEKVLHSYPNQLSGGEKSRFAFILALLKDTDIYLFDEPTSALDDIQANHVIEILKELKKEGKIIILSTHDHRLIQEGDRVYEIESQKLKVRKGKVVDIEKIENKTKPIFHINRISDYWHKMKKHHKMYNRIMKYVLALGIVLALCGIELGVVVRMKFGRTAEGNITDTLLVNKEPYQNAPFSTEDGLPFEKSDIEKIDSVKHIKQKYPYLRHRLIDRHSLEGGDLTKRRNEFFMQFDFQIVLNEQIQKITARSDYEKEEKGKILFGEFATYPDELNIDDYVAETWNEEGFYISKSFYDEYVKPMIQSEQDKKDIRIDFPLFVPMYNIAGNAHVGSYVASNAYAGIHVPVSMKIKGILKGDFIFEEPFYWSQMTFNLSNSEMQKYIDKYKVSESHICFYPYGVDKYICDEPVENYFPPEEHQVRDYTVETYTPYEPNAYVIQVDDVKNLMQVRQELKDIGFGVYSKYSDVTVYQEAEDNMRDMMFIVGSIAFILILATNIILKLNNKEEEKSFQVFFKEKGFTRKMIRKLNHDRFLINAIEITGTVVLEYALVNAVLYFTLGFFLFSSISELIIALVLIIITEFIVPMLLEVYYEKEERGTGLC